QAEPRMTPELDTGQAVPDEVVEMFDGAMLLGHLSTLRPDGSPSVVTVGVVIHDGKVRMSSRTNTKKIRNLRRDPRLSVCAIDPKSHSKMAVNIFSGWVMVRGTAELADDPDREFVDWLARTHMGQDEYPEPRDIPRTLITVRPEVFVIRTGSMAQ